jgi:dipeptidyl aminopeptidase/acylaminoacyl peptidase
VPHWSGDGSHFWYRNDLRGGKREYVLVDAVKGEKKPAFDHRRIAEALGKAGANEVESDRLALEDLTFDTEKGELRFRLDGKSWRCNLTTYEVAQVAQAELQDGEDSPAIHPSEAPRASLRTGPETEIRFVNQTDGPIELFWLDSEGERQTYGKLAAASERAQHTYAGHVWLAINGTGQVIAAFEAEENSGRAVITGKEIPRRGRGRRPSRSFNRDVSPDGKWRALVRDANVFVREIASEKETQLSHDGGPNKDYQRLEWSPDSRTLVAFRVEPGEEKDVFLVESSPRGGGRAVLHQRPYALPGDKFASHELNLFHLSLSREANKDKESDPELRWAAIKPHVERIDFGSPRLRFDAEGRRFTYTKIDRGHQRYRVIEVDAETGQTRNVIDEQTDTFIWTAHTEDLDVGLVTWLEKSSEIVYVSEVDGWRHLYLIDSAIPLAETSPENPEVASQGKRLFAPGLKNQITKGPFVVRGVDLLDEDARQIWFRASGLNPDQDPYFIHHCRVNFDGSGFVQLTQGNGDHSIQYSPDRKFLIDTYSRVDLPPVHELRRVEDGGLVCRLEEADITELEESGWKPPEVFVAKGRDGITDIWGLIFRPRDFESDRKYPVIEDIYAGPQGSFVPKRFSPDSRYRSLTDLGFVVVKIDGMGTANRSKAFHDMCWHNLKDAGFPDRILWMKAAGAKYPSMDLSRVGVYGGSAGGQNAAAAVLFHSEFYKAAVAGCGCHDNRMDKASWNEQWMGYPVGKQYSECSNIENARRLEGKLLLIVGEMDRNVPPESTMRFADALIKSDKDFDLLVVPGAGHGMGGAYGQRRMHQFFVRHLIGDE